MLFVAMCGSEAKVVGVAKVQGPNFYVAAVGILKATFIHIRVLIHVCMYTDMRQQHRGIINITCCSSVKTEKNNNNNKFK